MPEAFDVCAQLCECAVQFEDVWEKKNLDFEADLEDSAEVYADPGLLEVVWTNLLSNAVKFTPEGKHVSLALEGKTIVIADEGIGIPAEELAHIFDRFRRTRRSNEQGTGLGLAICSEVARRHGIAIDVASRVGEGTTFRFTFPDGGS